MKLSKMWNFPNLPNSFCNEAVSVFTSAAWTFHQWVHWEWWEESEDQEEEFMRKSNDRFAF